MPGVLDQSVGRPECPGLALGRHLSSGGFPDAEDSLIEVSDFCHLNGGILWYGRNQLCLIVGVCGTVGGLASTVGFLERTHPLGLREGMPTCGTPGGGGRGPVGLIVGMPSTGVEPSPWQWSDVAPGVG